MTPGGLDAGPGIRAPEGLEEGRGISAPGDRERLARAALTRVLEPGDERGGAGCAKSAPPN